MIFFNLLTYVEQPADRVFFNKGSFSDLAMQLSKTRNKTEKNTALTLECFTQGSISVCTQYLNTLD